MALHALKLRLVLSTEVVARQRYNVLGLVTHQNSFRLHLRCATNTRVDVALSSQFHLREHAPRLLLLVVFPVPHEELFKVQLPASVAVKLLDQRPQFLLRQWDTQLLHQVAELVDTYLPACVTVEDVKYPPRLDPELRLRILVGSLDQILPFDGMKLRRAQRVA